MSAYQVPDQTINRIVAMLTVGEYPSDERCKTLGRELVQMNDRAVSTRYEQRTQEIPYTWEPVFIDEHRISMGEIAYMAPLLKTLQCYLYQCSEGKVPEEHLYRRVDECRLNLQNQIMNAIPEYDQAPWA
jgi:hypothetical protein